MGIGLFVLRVIIGTGLVLALMLAHKVYWYFCPAANEAQLNRALFHPCKADGYEESLYKTGDITGEDVEILSGPAKTRLHGIVYRVKNENLFAIINHGNGGNIWASKPVVDTLTAKGVSVLCYDYRGYGKSEGEPTVAGVIEDASAAYDMVVKRLGIKPSNILFDGASLGSGVTTEIAKTRPSRGIILDSPFLSPERLAKEKLPYFNVYPSNLWFKPSLDNLAYVKGEHPPLLIVSAEDDNVIPSSHSKRLYKAASGDRELAVFPNSVHTWYCNNVDDFRAYQSRIGAFIKRLHRSKRAAKVCFSR